MYSNQKVLVINSYTGSDVGCAGTSPSPVWRSHGAGPGRTLPPGTLQTPLGRGRFVWRRRPLAGRAVFVDTIRNATPTVLSSYGRARWRDESRQPTPSGGRGRRSCRWLFMRGLISWLEAPGWREATAGGPRAHARKFVPVQMLYIYHQALTGRPFIIDTALSSEGGHGGGRFALRLPVIKQEFCGVWLFVKFFFLPLLTTPRCSAHWWPLDGSADARAEEKNRLQRSLVCFFYLSFYLILHRYNFWDSWSSHWTQLLD